MVDDPNDGNPDPEALPEPDEPQREEGPKNAEVPLDDDEGNQP